MSRTKTATPVASAFTSENHEINLAQTTFLNITLIDGSGNKLLTIELDRFTEATPQLSVCQFNKIGTLIQSNTLYDVNA